MPIPARLRFGLAGGGNPKREMNAARLTLRVPAEVDELPLLRNAVRLWLASRLPRDATEDVVLAVWEACATALGDPLPRSLAIELEAFAGRVWVVVKESGCSQTSANGVPEEDLGLTLIDGLMDHVSVARAPTGTVVCMFRDVHAAS